jgi:protein SCO1
MATKPPESHASIGLAGTFTASFLVLLLGLWLLYHATDHGRSYITESLRRDQISRQSAPIPDFEVFDSTGRVFYLKESLQGERTFIVDFIYTRCTSVCTAMGTMYQQLQLAIQAQQLAPQVGLLSISFDPEHDNPAALAAFAKRMQMDTRIWRVVSLKKPQDRQRLLDAFGIMVLPAANGEFEHNAAFHVVRSTQLVEIVGLEASAEILNTAITGLAK